MGIMKKFRRIPEEITAIQFDGTESSLHEIANMLDIEDYIINIDIYRGQQFGGIDSNMDCVESIAVNDYVIVRNGYYEVMGYDELGEHYEEIK